MPAPVLTISQMRQWEADTWATSQTEAEVIRRAGESVAAHAVRMTRPRDLILVLAGKGHNGDDARQAGPHLQGRRVILLEAADPVSARAEFLSRLPLQPSLLIDGLFGIGLNRRLEGDWKEFVEDINKAEVPIVSVDVPSGLNADTGQPQGATIHATTTLTLGAPKRGLLAASAWPYVGRLELAHDIGLAHCTRQSDLWWTLAEDFDRYPPPRAVNAHKGGFGHLGIIAGSLGYHGAAVLCARGALRAQPGLVTVLTPDNVYVPIASQLQAAMVRPWRPGMINGAGFTALVVGPGLASPDVSADLRNEIARSWEALPVPVVADASALDWLPRGATMSGRMRVVTPHPGEAARMLATTNDAVQRDRFDATRELSRRYGDCWVVLKGHQTCLGHAMGEIFINSSGNPFLAQGGSGDVLAGYLGGLLAQPALWRDTITLLRYGVWQHGATADWLSHRRSNWGIEDMAARLGTIR